MKVISYATISLVKITLFPIGTSGVIHHLQNCSSLQLTKWGWSPFLLDSAVAHGLGFAHSFAGDFEGCSLVGGDALGVSAQVWLHLLPHLLLGVQLFVWFTWDGNWFLRLGQVSQVIACFISPTFEFRDTFDQSVGEVANWVQYLESPGIWFCHQQVLHLEGPGFPPCLGSWHTWPWPGTPLLSSWLALGCKAGWPYGSASARQQKDARLQKIWIQSWCLRALDYLVQRYVLDQSADHSPGRGLAHIHLLHVQTVSVRVLLGFDYSSHAQIQAGHVHLGLILAWGGLFLFCFISSLRRRKKHHPGFECVQYIPSI